MSLRFETPEAFWALLPLLGLLIYMIVKRRAGAFSWRRWIIALVAFASCIVGLARPQAGHYATTQRGMRGDLFVAIDVSNSMRAEDVSPTRLEFATSFVRRLLREIPGLRVAIFPFAANGYLQMPLSSDQEAAADLIASLNPSITTNQGTDFEQSLESLLQAINRARQSNNDAAAPTRVLVLSDGETHEKVTRSLLDKFRSRSIPIDTVGIGTQEGGFIPAESRVGFGRDTLRDAEGKPVRTRLETKTLQSIAEGTGGSYYGPHFEEVGKVASRVMQGMEFGKLSTSFKLEREFFPLCFFIALLLFSFELLFGRWEYLVRSLLFVGFFTGSLHNALASDPDAKRPYNTYNEGVQKLEQGRADEAAELFAESAATAKEADLRKRALYNLGNTLVRLQDPTQALSAYQRGYDTKASSQNLEKELNKNISENILVARQMKQQQQQQQDKQEKGEGEGDSQEPPPNPGKAKQFQGQSFDENQKKKMYDLVSGEEQQIYQRLQQGKNQKHPVDPKGKQW